MSNVSNQIEALLFSEGGSMKKTRLAQLIGVASQELETALEELSVSLTGALTLVRTDNEVALVISDSVRAVVKKAHEKELGREIGDAGLEVLAIILYRGASTRAEIDYIRGVNTSSTIRNLLARGLLERAGNPLDGREYLYRPTTELLAHLGVTTGQELPDYSSISSELAAFEKRQESLGETKGDSEISHGE